MQATPSQLASYLSAFAESRAASDEYHAAMLRLIGGETINVASLQAKAIELAVLHSDWLQSALPLASMGACAKLSIVRPAWQRSGAKASPSARAETALSNELDWDKRWPQNLTSLARLVDTAKIPRLLTPVRSVCIDTKKLTAQPFRLDKHVDGHETYGRSANTKDMNGVVQAKVELPTVAAGNANEPARLPSRT